MAINQSAINTTAINATLQTAGQVEYYDHFYRAIRSSTGTVREAVSVTVYNAVNRTDPASGDNSVATIYSDPEGATSISNPLTTGADGIIDFYAPPGFYHLLLEDGSETVWVANQPLGNIKGQSREGVDITAGFLAGVAFTDAQELIAGLLSAFDFSTLGDYADDTAAAAGGVEIGALYRTGSTIKTRIA